MRRNKSLPGAQGADFSSRRVRPTVRSYGVRFSPTNRSFAAAATEGLLIYSMDDDLVFDPTDLDLDVTPDNVRMLLSQGDYLRALVMAVRLNEDELIALAYAATPAESIELVSRSFPDGYVVRLITFIAAHWDASPHVEFQLLWVRALLRLHGAKLRAALATMSATLPSLRSLHRAILANTETLTKVTDDNVYLTQYLLMSSRRPAPVQSAAANE